MVITIAVSDDTWNLLMKRKKKPSHTFDEIIRYALEETEKNQND